MDNSQIPRVAIVIYDGARLFDVATAVEVWRSDRLPVLTHVCAENRTALVGGVPFPASRTLSWLGRADLVIVPGFDIERPPDGGSVPGGEALARSLRQVSQRESRNDGPGCRRPILASMCAGAFVLAAAGLLDGREAVTHWSLTGELAKRFPRVTVRTNPLYLRSGRMWTSAGTAAGLDLNLELVRHLLGDGEADRTARRMVAAPHRRGDQAQFIATPLPDPVTGVHARIAKLVAVALAERWDVASAARAVHVSERTFARRFHSETGLTFHRWLTDQRLAEARRLLAHDESSVEKVASQVGMSTVTLRQRFRSSYGLSPAEYRAGFGSR